MVNSIKKSNNFYIKLNDGFYIKYIYDEIISLLYEDQNLLNCILCKKFGMKSAWKTMDKLTLLQHLSKHHTKVFCIQDFEAEQRNIFF